uniref:Polygalacturonase n=1 Tax=Dendroctonus ponderosae TaxID=77166 RepID=J3JW12_DENPD|nr:unknown [Dendroctonus ponderosae]
MGVWCLMVAAVLCHTQWSISGASVSNLLEGCEVTQFDQVEDAVQKCDTIIFDNLFVPAGETLNLQLRYNSTVYFRGNTTFGYSEWDGPLVAISATDSVIEGEDGSSFNGQGELYWDGLGIWGSLKPNFFQLRLHNTAMSNIVVLNPPKHSVILQDSTNVELIAWTIDASAGAETGGVEVGQNTDGFIVKNSTYVVLQNSVVYNQGDCVGLCSGAHILVDDVICYGGHGLTLSVGLSADNVELNTLVNVTFINSILSGGKNAIHIKTHVDGGAGKIEKVVYKNIEFVGLSEYGIIIQENYKNLLANDTLPVEPKNNIPITDLQLINIVGSVASSAIPVYILCAEKGCSDWTFSQVSVVGSEANSCNYEPSGFFC